MNLEVILIGAFYNIKLTWIKIKYSSQNPDPQLKFKSKAHNQVKSKQEEKVCARVQFETKIEKVKLGHTKSLGMAK